MSGSIIVVGGLDSDAAGDRIPCRGRRNGNLYEIHESNESIYQALGSYKTVHHIYTEFVQMPFCVDFVSGHSLIRKRFSVLTYVYMYEVNAVSIINQPSISFLLYLPLSPAFLQLSPHKIKRSRPSKFVNTTPALDDNDSIRPYNHHLRAPAVGITFRLPFFFIIIIVIVELECCTKRRGGASLLCCWGGGLADW